MLHVVLRFDSVCFFWSLNLVYSALRLSTRALFLGRWSRVCGWRFCEKQKKTCGLRLAEKNYIIFGNDHGPPKTSLGRSRLGPKSLGRTEHISHACGLWGKEPRVGGTVKKSIFLKYVFLNSTLEVLNNYPDVKSLLLTALKNNH